MNKNFRINNVTVEDIVEKITYDYISTIVSLTGPTGPLANKGVLTQDGTLLSSIIPDQNGVYDLGSSTGNFSNVYTVNLYINNVPIISNGSNLELPAGTMIGGVSIGTIQILGEFINTGQLPISANIGDSYIINQHLFVYSSGFIWIDIGTITGPQGVIGPTGYTG